MGVGEYEGGGAVVDFEADIAVSLTVSQSLRNVNRHGRTELICDLDSSSDKLEWQDSMPVLSPCRIALKSGKIAYPF